ncbi:LutC/YkgG family protein [Prevotella veroralis]|uniref:LutC/YkgG family protein n=1 Tax=Prevotella veroralis TaxID=28137 RepID=UPI000381002B|nr:LUD domain-containing protein [Prevotella veroralis]
MNKEELLGKLRRNTMHQFDMPEASIDGIKYENTIEQFIETSHKVGSEVIEAKAGEDLNELIRKAYPEAQVLASNVKGIKVDLNPDMVSEAQDLNGTDVGIVEGDIAVAENGCVWVPQTMKERVVCFVSENLVILVHRDKIVNNMHEAYRRIHMTEYGYGCFISGPSKTADIEQALVMGAQAARGVTVIIVD